MPDEMKLTDTQLLDLIEKHTLEVAFRLSDQGWRVWIADIPLNAEGGTAVNYSK